MGGTHGYAAITSPTDVIDFFTAQHEQIKSLFATTLAASGEAREEAFVGLRRLLAVHETVEEEIIHPRAKRKIAGADAVVDERLHEEHEAKTVLQRLEKLDVDSQEFTRGLTELGTPSSTTRSTKRTTSSQGWERN